MSFALRLDDVLNKFVDGCDCRIDEGQAYLHQSEFAAAEAKQAITSLIKELVAEAKPYRETIIDKWNKDRVDEVKATNAAMNDWADIYEQNLLKALEEV